MHATFVFVYVCWAGGGHTTLRQNKAMSLLSDPKRLRFIIQVFLTVVSMTFYAAMIAADTDKNIPIFLPLLTASVGYWFSSPKAAAANKKNLANDMAELKSVLVQEGTQRTAAQQQQQQMLLLQAQQAQAAQIAAARSAASAQSSSAGATVVPQ